MPAPLTSGAMLEDRSYMRENPHRSRWSATVILMIAVGACFFIQEVVRAYSRFPIGEYLALSVPGLRRGFIWQLLTFQFLHGGLFHLIFNLLGLWFFGRYIEERLGSRSFLKLYFLCGIVGGLVEVAAQWAYQSFLGLNPRGAIGASAGVLGIIAAFAIMEPHATIRIFFVLPVQARFLLWAELAISLFFTLVPSQSGVAHGAHLGGILAAIAYLRWDMPRPSIKWNPWQGRRRKRQLVQAAAQISRLRVRRDSPPAELPPEEFISKEVDPILDKISAHGIHSLTPRERQILEAARAKMAKR